MSRSSGSSVGVVSVGTTVIVGGMVVVVVIILLITGSSGKCEVSEGVGLGSSAEFFVMTTLKKN